MDSLNKIISFVLGLVVVLVFIAVISGKLNLKNKTTSTSTLTPTPIKKSSGGFFSFLNINRPTQTPTPTQKPFPTPTIAVFSNNIYNQDGSISKPSYPRSIPATGLPTLLIPILVSGLIGGNFLRKAGKK